MIEITHLLATRNNLIQLIDSLTTEQLNKIQEGFSNNIIWNFVHNIVTKQLLYSFPKERKIYLFALSPFSSVKLGREFNCHQRINHWQLISAFFESKFLRFKLY